MKHILFIALGGAAGALARHWLGSALSATAAPSHWPLGTLLVNALGSFLIGLAYVMIVERGLVHPDWRSVFMVGFLGAFTTFSTFSLEAITLLENGHGALAAGYIVMSVAVCLGGVWLALTLARMMG